MRPATSLAAKLETSLLAYAAAASAAGIGVLVMSQPSEARVVFTHADINLGKDHAFIDLNHDGVTDFILSEFNYGTIYTQWDALGAYCNGNSLAVSQKGSFARALRAGVQVGPKKNFRNQSIQPLMTQVRRAVSSSRRYFNTYFYGPWANNGKGVRRYVGLKFKINGETHFGWAKVNTYQPFNGGRTHFLKGYAYETTPNQPIVAGDKGTGASLGHLATGAAGRKPPAY